MWVNVCGMPYSYITSHLTSILSRMVGEYQPASKQWHCSAAVKVTVGIAMAMYHGLCDISTYGLIASERKISIPATHLVHPLHFTIPHYHPAPLKLRPYGAIQMCILLLLLLLLLPFTIPLYLGIVQFFCQCAILEL